MKGITYTKLTPPAAEQALAAAQFMKGRFLDGNDLRVRLDERDVVDYASG
jgi:hypothetical protein